MFNLARLLAKTKNRHISVRDLLFADDATFVSHSETGLQTQTNSFVAACEAFSLVTIGVGRFFSSGGTVDFYVKFVFSHLKLRK